MFAISWPQIGRPLRSCELGSKPPWNQPQVTPRSFSRLPMFLPVISPVTPPGTFDGFPFDGGAFERGARVGALVVTRFGVALQHAADDVACCCRRHRAFGVAADQVDRAGGRRTELVAVGVVVQRVVLSVVPQCGHGVAVVVIHDDAAGTVGAAVFGVGRAARAAGGLLDEHVHLPVVLGFLLRGVAVVLVAGQRFVAAEALGVELIRVVFQQRFAEAVHRRRARGRRERRFSGAVGGIRIGAEVVIERDVLREENDDVFDRRRGGRQGGGRRRAGHRDPEDGRTGDHRGGA